jgi:O-antigen/teichoic acid export membrane protein
MELRDECALLPLWTRLFESDRNRELLELRESLLDLIMLLCVPAAIAISIFAPEICALLGSRFASSTLVLRILAYRILLSVVDGFLGHGFLIAINRSRTAARRLYCSCFAGHFDVVPRQNMGSDGRGMRILSSLTPR